MEQSISTSKAEFSSKSVSLDLGELSYDITVDWGLRERLADQLIQWNVGQQWVVVSQQVILNHYSSVVDGLRDAGLRVLTISVPSDESAKDINVAESVWAQMIDAGCDRSSIVIAMGGGVVGDLAGFIAATFMRGIPVIQLPTTLLAMVDSAIGGKTAVNLAAGKNLVGAIHQPKAVLIDPEFLATLPRRNVVSSLAEVIKYGFIRDLEIIDIFEQRFDELLSLNNAELISRIILKSCGIKAKIVSNDQFEDGDRKLLNYGHTLGHAFETLHGHGGLYHGEAVLYGMLCANYISYNKKLLSGVEYQRAQAILARFDLPRMDMLSDKDVLELVSHDKKNINGELNFILLDGLGNGIISNEVSQSELLAALSIVR